MWRVERISLDESTSQIPSLRDQVERRTGRPIEQLACVFDRPPDLAS
jgi:hypothetical protein